MQFPSGLALLRGRTGSSRQLDRFERVSGVTWKAALRAIDEAYISHEKMPLRFSFFQASGIMIQQVTNE